MTNTGVVIVKNHGVLVEFLGQNSPLIKRTRESFHAAICYTVHERLNLVPLEMNGPTRNHASIMSLGVKLYELLQVYESFLL